MKEEDKLTWKATAKMWSTYEIGTEKEVCPQCTTATCTALINVSHCLPSLSRKRLLD